MRGCSRSRHCRASQRLADREPGWGGGVGEGGRGAGGEGGRSQPQPAVSHPLPYEWQSPSCSITAQPQGHIGEKNIQSQSKCCSNPQAPPRLGRGCRRCASEPPSPSPGLLGHRQSPRGCPFLVDSQGLPETPDGAQVMGASVLGGCSPCGAHSEPDPTPLGVAPHHRQMTPSSPQGRVL